MCVKNHIVDNEANCVDEINKFGTIHVLLRSNHS